MNEKANAAQTASSQPAQAGFFAKILTFIREVVAELKKVIWPTKDELTTYFGVVIVFVLAMVVFTGVVDIFFSWLVNFVFGG